MQCVDLTQKNCVSVFLCILNNTQTLIKETIKMNTFGENKYPFLGETNGGWE